MAQINEKWRFSDPWSSETGEPIKFSSIDDVGEGETPMPKLVYVIEA